MRLLTALLFAGTLLLAYQTPAIAQAINGSVASVVREAFVVREFEGIELPQATVRAVHVGRKGFLWVGTREGLVQYKSGEQTIWRQSTDGIQGLPSGVVNTIYEDSEGTIWAGTARGIAKLPVGANDFEIVIQSQTTEAKQLDIHEIIKSDNQLIAVSASGVLLRINDSEATPIAGIENLQDEQFTAAAWLEETFFVGAVSGMIYRLEMVNDRFEIRGSLQSPGPVIHMDAGEDSLVWLDRDEGMMWSNANLNDSPGNANPLVNDAQGYYRALTAESPDSAWFAAGPSIIRQKNGVSDVVRLPGRGNEVRSITVDQVGNIWIGTYYGLFYALDTDFTVLETASAYDSGVMLSVAANADTLFIGGQNLWSGSFDSQEFEELSVTVPGINKSSLRIDPQAVGQSPTTALAASEKNLLVGYMVGGMDVVDLDSGNVTNVITAPAGESFANVGVSSFAAVDKNTWLGSFYRYGLAEIRVDNTSDGPPDVQFTKVSDQTALIGVYRLSDTQYIAINTHEIFVFERTADGSYRTSALTPGAEGIVFAVEPDGDGGIFLGVEGVGVRHLSEEMLAQGRYQPTTIPIIEQYLEGRTSWHLMLDSDKTLWVTTNHGVYTFDLEKQELLAHVTYSDGLPNNEFDYGPNARLITPNGDRIFVSAKVPVVFSQPVRNNSEKLNLFWTDFSVNGQVLPQDRISGDGTAAALEVDFRDVSTGTLRLDYGYYDHVRSSELSYATRSGDEEQWELQRTPSIVMTRRQSWGKVAMEVAMIDTNGEVASEPLSVTVNIDPPFYIFWIFDIRSAAPPVLVMLTALALMQRRHRRRQQSIVNDAKRKREIYEAEMRGRVSEKEILLRELHHRVGNILTSFSSNVRAMQRSATQTETRDSLAHLNARLKVQSAVHRLLQRSDRTDINVGTMIRRVSYGVRDLAKTKDPRPIQFQLEDVFMTYSKAHYIGLIVNELVTNTYKHAGESTSPVLASITLSLSAEKNSLMFHYRDYGAGVPDTSLVEASAKKRYSELKGLGQVIGLARELNAVSRLYNDNGLHFEFNMQFAGDQLSEPLRDTESISTLM